jgi:uncharacterized protein YbjQ (UPF0145 family)
MDRRPGSCWPWMALLVVLLTLPAVGCRNAIATALWAFGAGEVQPEYDGLKGKKVAVVCRPPSSMQFQDPRIARDLAAEVGRHIKDNCKKVTLVDDRKVENWCDSNTWDEFVEVGKALGADVVVGIDLEQFSIHEGQTLYKGRANVTLVVQDCKEEEGKRLFEKTMPQVVYPPNNCVPASDIQAAQFRRGYVKVLADHVGRHFYGHDPYADIGLDATTL